MHKSLNPVQRQAVEHGEGPCLVLAGPGSGKTFVITRRIQYLIKQRQIPPEQILVITFTRASALEMKERFLKLSGDSYLPVQFGTFHAIFFHILKQTIQLDRQALLTQQEKYDILEEIVERELGRGKAEPALLELLLKEFSRRKNKSPDGQSLRPQISTLSEKQISRLGQCYQEAVQSRQKLDFDDMVVRCRDLFYERPDVLAYWQEQFQYLLIDEFQDINAVQFEVVQMLVRNHQNLFVVGDDDQSIYGFRGSKPDIMLQFQKFYPKVKVLKLNLNYRSRAQIIQAADQLIRHNHRRYEKSFLAARDETVTETVTETGMKTCATGRQALQVRQFESEEQLHAFLLPVLEEHRAHLNQVAVIFRTNLAAASLLEFLARQNIPFQSREKLPNPYEHFIVQDLLAYLRLANGDPNRRDFYRIMNKPKRYLGRGCVWEEKISFDGIRAYYRDKYYMKEHIDKLEYVLRKIRDMPVYAAVMFLRRQGGYDQYLTDYAKEKNVKLADLLKVLDDFMELVKDCDTLQELERRQEVFEHSLQMTGTGSGNGDRDEKGTEKGNGLAVQENAVHILTYHGSKGLEFDTVILPGLQDGLVPHRRSTDMEEERRMFYVAMTRAREQLYLLAVQGTQEHPQFPSRFLNEITP